MVLPLTHGLRRGLYPCAAPRLVHCSYIEFRNALIAAFGRPYGTCSSTCLDPALKGWAIIATPPPGLVVVLPITHGLRRGLYPCAASRLMPSAEADSASSAWSFSLEPGVNWFALEGQHTEDALVNAAKGLLVDKALEGFYS